MFNRSVTFNRNSEDTDRYIYYFLGNNGGEISLSSGGTAVMTKMVFNRGSGLKITVPKIDNVTLTADVDSLEHGSATVNGESSVTVNTNTSVSFAATPNTG